MPNHPNRSKMLRLTTEHPMSSYGIPVLVDAKGNAYGTSDKLPTGETAREWVARRIPSDPLAAKFLGK